MDLEEKSITDKKSDHSFVEFIQYAKENCEKVTLEEKPDVTKDKPLRSESHGVVVPRPSQVYAQPYISENGSVQGALLSFNGQVKDDLLRRFKANYSIEGDHIKHGGALSPQTMLTLIGSGTGALGVSAAMSGTLFMATANPATLMAIGNGVGSAVMGASGIVAQAPFIPVTGALMPVLAPLLAFQAISTVLIMNQFKGIHERLDHIEQA